MLVCIDQDNIEYYFPVQSCSPALDQHCTGSCRVQCWQRQIKTTLYRLISCENAFVRVCVFARLCIWATLTRQYSYAMWSQHGRYNIVQVIYHIKVVCLAWPNIAQVISLCNVDPEKSRHHCKLFFSTKLFVDYETIDPRAAGKYSFFFFFFLLLLFFFCF